MAFKRINQTPELLQGKSLNAALVGIGINLANHPSPNPNIEGTLLAASVEGMVGEDLRVLALLMTWLEAHAAWINADRLTRIVALHPSARVRCFWSAVAVWLGKDRRFARMAKAYTGRRRDLLATGTAFHLSRKGEDARFAGGPLCVPAGILRHRPADVFSPVELARIHGPYRRRIMLGPSYRADMWAELDADATLSAAELARRTYGSFATAWNVKQDWQLVAEVVGR